MPMTVQIPTELARACRRQLRHPQLVRTLHDELGSERRLGGGQAVSTEIHPRCQMLAHSLAAHGDAALSVSQYFGVALQQFRTAVHVIDRVEARTARPTMLDFACGFGRLLNLLVRVFPPGRIWASDIQSDAVEFVRDRFGVHALPSSARPEDFDPGRRFDLIWVASLFSHLPPGLFERWLERLAGLLTPDGILFLTVHDEALLPAGMALPADGILYRPESENPDLDADIYGTTFVDEAYVRRAVGEAVSPGRQVLRLPRLIAYEQDTYIVAGSDGRGLTEFTDLPRGLRGWLDEHEVDEGGRLRMRGWAGSMDSDRPARIEITVDGRPVAASTGEARPRVAEVLGKPGLAYSGWSAVAKLPVDRADAWVRIVAHDPRGQRALIFAGAVDNPAFRGD